MPQSIRAIAERAALVEIARMIDGREDPSGKHITRIQKFSLLLAKAVATSPIAAIAAEITAEFLAGLPDAVALHDIGKVCIPDATLLKPARLTETEFSIIEMHPNHGAKRFAPTAASGFMRLAHDVIRHHHEKLDGTGYPDRLQGDAIPLGARILAIADSYDALKTWRCYKAATSLERALDVIQKASGKHFDSRFLPSSLISPPTIDSRWVT